MNYIKWGKSISDNVICLKKKCIFYTFNMQFAFYMQNNFFLLKISLNWLNANLIYINYCFGWIKQCVGYHWTKE